MTPTLGEITLPSGLRVSCVEGSQAEVSYIYREIFEEGVYARGGIDVEDGATIVDVGSNIGLFALSMMARRSRLRLYCFEPVPIVHEALRRNVQARAEEKGHRVHLSKIAVSDREREGEIVFFPTAPGNSTARLDLKKKEPELIATSLEADDLKRRSRLLWLGALLTGPIWRRLVKARIAALLRRRQTFSCHFRPLSQVIDEEGLERIDLLKIDVEGSEIEALEGVHDLHWPRIRQVVMECSPALTPRLGELEERFRRLGFEVETVGEFSGRDRRGERAERGERPSLPTMLYARRVGE